MKALYNYIVEKLKINKDSKIESDIDNINNEFIEKISKYIFNTFNIEMNKVWDSSISVSDSKKFLMISLVYNKKLYPQIMGWININLNIRQKCKRNSQIIYVYPKYD